MAKRKITLDSGETHEFVVGSENPFADFGFPDAEERYYKAKMVGAIETEIVRRKLKQREAAKILGIAQPDLSKMLNGHFMGFSVDKLTQMLLKIGVRVEMTLFPPEAVDVKGVFVEKMAG